MGLFDFLSQAKDAVTDMASQAGVDDVAGQAGDAANDATAQASDAVNNATSGQLTKLRA